MRGIPGSRERAWETNTRGMSTSLRDWMAEINLVTKGPKKISNKFASPNADYSMNACMREFPLLFCSIYGLISCFNLFFLGKVEWQIFPESGWGPGQQGDKSVEGYSGLYRQEKHNIAAIHFIYMQIHVIHFKNTRVTSNTFLGRLSCSKYDQGMLPMRKLIVELFHWL